VTDKKLDFRTKEKGLIQGKIQWECKCIARCFNDEIGFLIAPKGKVSKLFSCVSIS
jgi:hypothetical protein